MSYGGRAGVESLREGGGVVSEAAGVGKGGQSGVGRGTYQEKERACHAKPGGV
jgi:hypothetical protein